MYRYGETFILLRGIPYYSTLYTVGALRLEALRYKGVDSDSGRCAGEALSDR
jgi:hypothetical protein